MGKRFINVTIDERPVTVQLGYTIMQTCSQAGTEVPRFCYHDKLLIAGNCRICLVEVTGSKKLVASCAIHATDNMSVYTNTVRVRVARQNVLEFLLANHPLDCPICDQGGECDLQDITAVFGADRGRFYEFEKRAVLNKDFGPLIRTSMNRCIHCTRCVRFLALSSGASVLGTLGRGSSTEIGLYINQFIQDELSGNITDLCPVGALTSKPYSFKARPWELVSIEGVDVLDSMNANILFDVVANRVSRVLPYANEAINECWITNKARYAYDGLFVQRLNNCLFRVSFSFFCVNTNLIQDVTNRKNNFFVKLSWVEAFSIFFEKLVNTNVSYFFSYVNGLTDFESIVGGAAFFNTLGAGNIMYDLSSSFQSSTDFNFLYLFNASLVKLAKLPTFCLLVGVTPRFEAPLLNLRLIKLVSDYGVQIYKIGSTSHYSFFPIRHLSSNLKTFFDVCEFRHIFCKNFYIFKFLINPFILIGQSLMFKLYSSRGLSEALLGFTKRLVGLQKFSLIRKFLVSEFLMFGFLSTYSGRLHALDVGVGRGILNFFSVNPLNIRRFSHYFSGASVFYSIGHDESVSYTTTNVQLNNCWTVYQGTHGVGLARSSDLVFPTISYVEKSSVFKNLMGLTQRSAVVVSYELGAKSDLEVFRSMLQTFFVGFFAKFIGFEYDSGVVFNLNLIVDPSYLGENTVLFLNKTVLVSKLGAVWNKSGKFVLFLLMGDFFLNAVRTFKLKTSLCLMAKIIFSFSGTKVAESVIASSILNYYGDSSISLLVSSKTMSLCSSLYVHKNFSFSHVFI